MALSFAVALVPLLVGGSNSTDVGSIKGCNFVGRLSAGKVARIATINSAFPLDCGTNPLFGLPPLFGPFEGMFQSFGRTQITKRPWHFAAPIVKVVQLANLSEPQKGLNFGPFPVPEEGKQRPYSRL